MSSKVFLYIIPYNQLWGVSGLKGLFYALKEELLEPLSPFFGSSPVRNQLVKVTFHLLSGFGSDSVYL